MTNINKLFSRYFIITITLILVILSLLTNIGGSVYFRDFIQSRNDEQNEIIVETINDMVSNDALSENSYVLFMTLLSRQEQVHLILYRDGKVTSYSPSVSLFSRLRGAANKPDDVDTREIDMEEAVNKLMEDENIYFIDYEIGLYKLSIGRPNDPLYDIASSNFMRTMNKLHIISFIIAVIIAFIAALILSRRFNRPIMQLRDNVNHISMNRYEEMKECETKAVELRELSDDIDNLARQIKSEEDMRRRLSNDIVHELKTPIAVLSTNLEAIMDGIYDADDERISVLLSQTNRLARLVNNLSDLTQMETEYGESVFEDVNLSDVLESIYTVYLPAATDKSIELKKDFEDNLIIKGNEDRLLQVFVNIVSNSMKYTDGGGSITMRSYSSGDEIRCEIEDTGIGIGEEDLPFIFNRFYRGDESRSRETGGSGIGLAIAKAVVSAHGGTIEIESEKGKGTLLKIIFKKNK